MCFNPYSDGSGSGRSPTLKTTALSAGVSILIQMEVVQEAAAADCTSRTAIVSILIQMEVVQEVVIFHNRKRNMNLNT